MGRGSVGGGQHGGGDRVREVHSGEREGKCELGHAGGARSTDYECRRKNQGRVEVRVEYVEAVCMRAGTEVTVCRRRSAGLCEGEAPRSREQSVNDAEGRRLADRQWRIRGDVHAG
jgi:hypothetical protein